MTPSILDGSGLVLLAAAAATAWVLKGLLAEARNRIGQRFADWLFPVGHPLTYRLSRLVLSLTGHLVPRHQTLFRLGPLFFPGASTPLFYKFNPELQQRHLQWDDLDAASAELEVDESGDRKAKPVRLVGPLLFRAVGDRLRNARARLLFAVWFLLIRPGAIALLIALTVVAYVVTGLMSPLVWLYRGLIRWATGEALVKAATRRIPDDMRKEEREFWIKAMHADTSSVFPKILTKRFAVGVWIRGKPRFPDRSEIERGKPLIRRQTRRQDSPVR